MPWRLAAASPLTMVTGVEMTSAHGQPMTSSTSAIYTASAQPLRPSRGGRQAVSRASRKMEGV